MCHTLVSLAPLAYFGGPSLSPKGPSVQIPNLYLSHLSSCLQRGDKIDDVITIETLLN